MYFFFILIWGRESQISVFDIERLEVIFTVDVVFFQGLCLLKK